VRAGDVPNFSLASFEVDNKTIFPTFQMKSEVAKRLQLASRLEGEGRLQKPFKTIARPWM
jgi:hypothetical protein